MDEHQDAVNVAFREHQHKEDGRKACAAMDFLRDHPAIQPVPAENILMSWPCWGGQTKRDPKTGSTLPNIEFWMSPICSRGFEEYAGVMVGKDDPRFQEFSDLVEEGDDPSEDGFELWVPYGRYFGEAWKFHRVEYCIDPSFYVFKGNPADMCSGFDHSQWDFINSGHAFRERSFEQAVIMAARHVAETFGAFSHDSFLTPEERDNHAKQCPFLFAADGRHLTFENPDYKHVNNGLINMRWLAWFLGTKACQDGFLAFEQEWFDSLRKYKIRPVQPLPVQINF